MNIFSSNIKTADYDRTKKELTMVFINRPRWTYTYKKVPITVWNKFIKAESKGQYFSGYIKDIYNFSKTIK